MKLKTFVSTIALATSLLGVTSCDLVAEKREDAFKLFKKHIKEQANGNEDCYYKKATETYDSVFKALDEKSDITTSVYKNQEKAFGIAQMRLQEIIDYPCR